MNLDDAPESSNVEDSRGMGTKLAVGYPDPAQE